MGIEQWIEAIAQQGILGVLLVVLGWAYWKKDQRITELNNLRHEDSKEKLELAERVFTLVDKLSDLFKKNGGSHD